MLQSALSTIDSPESLAEFEGVINHQVSTMKHELLQSNTELKQFENQFKQDIESIEKDT